MTGCPQNRAINIRLKGNASVISSDPPCKDDNAQFTRIAVKGLIKYELDINVYVFEN